MIEKIWKHIPVRKLARHHPVPSKLVIRPPSARWWKIWVFVQVFWSHSRRQTTLGIFWKCGRMCSVATFFATNWNNYNLSLFLRYKRKIHAVHGLFALPQRPSKQRKLQKLRLVEKVATRFARNFGLPASLLHRVTCSQSLTSSHWFCCPLHVFHEIVHPIIRNWLPQGVPAA